MIQFSRVSKLFSGGSDAFLALDTVDLRLPAGEFVAIVGKSGSGKTTLANLIAGLDQPSSGEIRVADTDIRYLDESSLAVWRGRNVGVVFQFFQLLPTLTIAENVMLPMDFCATCPPREARQRALRLLEQMGIAEQADKLPTSLSGGQQQRAAIARALANDPPLVVADEPTGNLDSHTAQSVLNLLAKLVDAGKTVVMVTHEQDIRQLADRIVTLADGQVIEQVFNPTARLNRLEAKHD